jgi:hypothetical protein
MPFGAAHPCRVLFFQLQLLEIYGKIEFSLYIQQSQTDKLLILVLPPTVSPISECVALQCGGAERAVLSISSHKMMSALTRGEQKRTCPYQAFQSM